MTDKEKTLLKAYLENEKQSNNNTLEKMDAALMLGIDDQLAFLDQYRDSIINETTLPVKHYGRYNGSDLYGGSNIYCAYMHQIARRMNNSNMYPLKIRYIDSNSFLPANISTPRICSLYFDWKPTLKDQIRYKFDDLIGWFGF